MFFFNINACQHILLHQTHKIVIFKIASYDPFNDTDSNRHIRLQSLQFISIQHLLAIYEYNTRNALLYKASHTHTHK